MQSHSCKKCRNSKSEEADGFRSPTEGDPSGRQGNPHGRADGSIIGVDLYASSWVTDRALLSDNIIQFMMILLTIQRVTADHQQTSILFNGFCTVCFVIVLLVKAEGHIVAHLSFVNGRNRCGAQALQLQKNHLLHATVPSLKHCTGPQN